MTESEFAARKTLSAPAESMNFAPGTKIGEYTVSSLLIEGSQATLFRVSDGASAPFIMRVYFDGHSPKEELTRSLLHTRKASLCSIVTNGTHDEHYYDIVPVLRSIPDMTRLDKEEQLSLIKSEAEAVKSFHETGYCHHDIKAEHFMQDPEGTVKLVDIGSAERTGNAVPTAVSQFLPLDARSEQVRQESDLFSFGVALLEQFLPGLFGNKSRTEIVDFVSSQEQLREAVNRLPEYVKNDIGFLLSDNPEARRECRWFKEERAENETSAATGHTIQELTDIMKFELMSVAVFCAPKVFTSTVKTTARSVNFNDPVSLSSFIAYLQALPKASGQVNYTTLTLDNVIGALNKEIVTEPTRLSKTDPVKTLHEYEKRHVLYIFDRQLINDLDRQGAVISEQREKRAFATLKIIGIVLGVIVGIIAAIAIIIAVLYLLFIIIGVIVVVGIICLLFSNA